MGELETDVTCVFASVSPDHRIPDLPDTSEEVPQGGDPSIWIREKAQRAISDDRYFIEEDVRAVSSSHRILQRLIAVDQRVPDTEIRGVRGLEDRCGLSAREGRTLRDRHADAARSGGGAGGL